MRLVHFSMIISSDKDRYDHLEQVLYRIASVLTKWELVFLTAVYAVFVISDQIPISGVIVICLLWAARWWSTGRLTVTTPMDLPILGILVMVPVSLYASIDWTLSLPKVYGIILSIVIFYAVVNQVHMLQNIWLTIWGLILASLAIALLGLIGTDWPENKLFVLPQLYEHLPQVIQGIPRSLEGGFHPNGIGGTLIFFTPVLVNLLLTGREFQNSHFVDRDWRLRLWQKWYKPIVLLSLLLTSFILILTKSRSAYIGVMAGLWALALWHDRRFLWMIPAVMIGLFLGIQVWGWDKLLTSIAPQMDITGAGSLLHRVELWQRAVYMIQDFPFTGIGIGTFVLVVNIRYPVFAAVPKYRLVHAHNEWLQVAVDMGIPALMAYGALLSIFAIAAWRAYHTLPDPTIRALIVGIVCGMLAHQVFGIGDAFLLGTKPGVVMWGFLGIVVALYLHQDRIASQLSKETVQIEEDNVSPSITNGNSLLEQLRARLPIFAYWIFFSLLAIAFIRDLPYVSLVIVLAGSIVVGFTSISSFESTHPELRKP